MGPLFRVSPLPGSKAERSQKQVFVFFLAFEQFLLATINDSENDNLRQFTTRINTYFGEILDFLTYARDEVPFPFSPLGRPKDP